MSESVYACWGCGRESPTSELKNAWLKTGLGICSIYAHAGCEKAAIREAENRTRGPVKIIDRPRTREERERERAQA